MTGLFDTLHIADLDHETLYNAIDGKGVMLYGPVSSSMKTLNASSEDFNIRFWLSVHEVKHSFQEGGLSLVASGALTEETLE